MSVTQAFYINLGRYRESFGVASVGVEGIITMQAMNPVSGISRTTTTFPNLITNLGLDSIGSSPNFTSAQVGTGTAAPVITNTSLGIYGTGFSFASASNGIVTTPDRYVYSRVVFLSSVGGATGNWTEIGISNQNATGNLRSHALIVDNMGNPTTFTVLADEQLQVTYEFRVYVPTVDVPATITLSGTPYDTVTRALNATSAAGSNAWPLSIEGSSALPSPGNTAFIGAYTGGLGSITDTNPMGSTLTGTKNTGTADYTTGNYFRDVWYRWGAGQGVGNIRTLRLQSIAWAFQVEYTPVIAKLTTQELIHWQRYSWARR